MAELTQQQIEAQIDKALEAAEAINSREPRAEAVFFDSDGERVVIHFTNGATFSFPTAAVEELANLSNTVLAEVTLTPGGKGLRWETPDLDLSIQGLLMGIFGSKQWMAELGRQGGAVKTERKAAAARENGKKGGRRRKRETIT